MILHLLREHVEQIQPGHGRHRARRRREHRAWVHWKRLAYSCLRLSEGKMLRGGARGARGRPVRGDARPLVELHCLVGLLFAEAHDRRDMSSVDVFAPASGKVLSDLVECHFRTKERGHINPSASYQQITKRKFRPPWQ